RTASPLDTDAGQSVPRPLPGDPIWETMNIVIVGRDATPHARRLACGLEAPSTVPARSSMSPPSATCPYCNSRLGEVAPGPRPLCPRCGEPLPAGTAPDASPTEAPVLPGRDGIPGASGVSHRPSAG